MDRKDNLEHLALLYQKQNRPLTKAQREELARKEAKKPEWLRGVTGSGPLRKAELGPADKDGNPLES